MSSFHTAVTPTSGVEPVPKAANDKVSPGNKDISYGVKSTTAIEVAETTVENTCFPPDTVTYDVGAWILLDTHDWPPVIVTPWSALVPSSGTNTAGPDE